MDHLCEVPRTHKKKSEKSNKNLGKGVWAIHPGRGGLITNPRKTPVKEMVYECFQIVIFNITVFILVSYWLGLTVIWRPFLLSLSQRRAPHNFWQ
jgi:hypothetical protein